MTSRKNVGDIRHLVVFRVMIEVCDTGLTDDQYGDLLEYLKHDEVLWSDENKNDFYNVATKLAKNGLKMEKYWLTICLLHSKEQRMNSH